MRRKMDRFDLLKLLLAGGLTSCGPSGGTVYWSWYLTMGGAPTTCEAANINTTSLRFCLTADADAAATACDAISAGLIFCFPCRDYQGTTQIVPNGQYTIQAQALGAAGPIDLILPVQTIAGNTDLGIVAFPTP